MKTSLTTKLGRNITLLTLAATMSIMTIACSSSQNAETIAKLEIPKSYSADLVSEYGDLARAGYKALDDGESAKAIESFIAQLDLIPEGKLGSYNLACVYGRTGDMEKGIHWLKAAVENGWDSPDDLMYDSDLTPLQASPEFAAILEQCEATRDTKDQMFAAGLPEYTTPTVTFATAEELEEWADAQNKVLRSQRTIWHSWQQAAAKLDFHAQRLAAEKVLRKDDPTYDYALTRVKTVGTIKSIWECWGPLSDGVVDEAKAYLATTPAQAGADEANYLAGMALAKKYCEDEPTVEQIAANVEAQSYFAKVSDASSYSGSAQAWLMEYKLEAAEAEGPEKVEALYADVSALIAKCREAEDRGAMRVMAVNFHTDAVRSLWPMDLNQPDYRGKNVSLEDYKGKVVLLDFWATWCGPCIAELPNLKAVYQKYHEQGFEVLGVSLDYEDRINAEDLEKWTDKKDMPWRHIYEGKGWKISLAERFMVNSIPAVFLVGRDGSLIAMGEDVHGKNLEPAVIKALAAGIN